MESPFVEYFLVGLRLGSIYALIALGYTMVYGIVELINFAHGEIYMIGAFIALIVATILEMSGMTGVTVLVLAVVAAMVYAGAYGVTIEKIAYKPLRHAPRLSPLISAIGMSLFLQNYVLLAQTPNELPFPGLVPEFEFLEPYSHIIGSGEVVIVAVAALTMVALTILIQYTRLGRAMRATAQDRTMAMLVGIPINRVISATFLIGSTLAALGGVLIASQMQQINYFIGFKAGIKAFTAAVLGGIGSIPGAVLGSLVLGWTEAFATWFIRADYQDVVSFSLLVLILIFRPAGLLGKVKTQKV